MQEDPKKSLKGGKINYREVTRNIKGNVINYYKKKKEKQEPN